MNDQPLPAVPVPDPPADPACEWCGARPAELYEVAPPVLSMKKRAGPSGNVETVKALKRAATMAYACREHRDTFDRRKEEAVERKRRDAEAKKNQRPYGGPGR